MDVSWNSVGSPAVVRSFAERDGRGLPCFCGSTLPSAVRADGSPGTTTRSAKATAAGASDGPGGAGDANPSDVSNLGESANRIGRRFEPAVESGIYEPGVRLEDLLPVGVAQPGDRIDVALGVVEVMTGL